MCLHREGSSRQRKRCRDNFEAGTGVKISHSWRQ